jgi:hypothetical protein
VSDGVEAAGPRDPANERAPEADHILAVRIGHGANCSSIGSVIDTLFATATVGAAVFAAVVAALKAEDMHIVSLPAAGADRPGEGRAEPEP